MSTQKEKFELFARLQSLGFTYEESAALRRIEMMLQRWFEYECGTGDDRTTRSIEREGENGDGKPFMRVQYATAAGWVDRKYPIADREAGARRRLTKIMESHPGFAAYVQGDPRGCALYIVRKSDVPAGKTLDQFYICGVAVCA